MMTKQQMTREDLINEEIAAGADTNKISDGYHTFQDLYAHRNTLFIALSNLLPNEAWKARKHADGTIYEGWFIAGIMYLPGEQISYHLPLEKWELLHCRELHAAPPFDGHTPSDVLERLLKL